MKYIRTKDGRIIDLERYENKTSPILKTRGFITLIDKLKICDIEIYENDIIKQADTIEELCDLFVDTTGLKGIADGWRFDGYDKSKKALWWISTSETTRYIPISEWNDKTAIKGAIWTEWGLKYVAKMNEKGELELL